MKITLQKKLKASEKKEFIFRNNSYDWDVNYEKLILDYVDGDFSYDKDNRHNLIDNEEISDIMYDDIYCMFKKSGLNINNKNNIQKAITKICKKNEFSNKEKERLERKIRQEQDKLKKEQEKEQKRQNEQKNKKELPDKLFNYIKIEYGDNLSYNIYKELIYYDDRPITKQDINNIVMHIQTNVMFEKVLKRDIQVVIHEVAKLRKFEDNLIMNEDINKNWNILDGVDGDKWQEYLIKDKGAYKHNTYNYALFLSFHPQFRNNILYNSFDKIESLHKYDKDYGKIVNMPIDDDLIHLIEAQIEQYFGDFNTKYVERALSVVLNNNSFHDIKQRFRNFENEGWDGKPRMHEIMIKYFGCDDCKEIREMTEVMLCGSVQRILEESPDAGTMFDYMGIQFGKQGTGKTKFMTRLYLGDKYTSINPDINDDQKFTDLTNRAWLVLFDEMKSIDKSDMGTVKSRITEQGANVRLSYGRRSKYYPRHVVFWGNTNYIGVLRDEGYERRFLCFECKNEKKHSAEWWNKNFTDYDIQQIWAETLQIYHEKWEGKVIEISTETEEWNYVIQNRHKIWVEDSRTDIEIKEILNCKSYNYPIYEPHQFRIWMKLLDGIKLGNGSEGKHQLNFVQCSWVNYRIPRRMDWITGMVERLGWKKIHVKDEIFGDADYFIRKDLSFEDIKNEWKEYSNSDFIMEKLPF